MSYDGTVFTLDQLDRLVADYSQFDEWCVDVETLGTCGRDARDPHTNQIFWVSLAGPGRADVIPCGHPHGERIDWPQDEQRRINPANRHYQERQVNPDTGRLKWFDVPEPFEEPPKQLWVSDVMEGLRPLFFRRNKRIVNHNLKFDILSMCKYWGGKIPSGKYGDTVVAAKLVNENYHNYQLASCVQRAFHFAYDKIGKIGVERFSFSEARAYSYSDAKWTWLLWQYLKPQLREQQVRHVFDMEMHLLSGLMDSEKVGVGIDEAALDKLGRSFELEMAELQLKLNKDAGWEIELTKNVQIAELVYDVCRHRCVAFTDKGNQLIEERAKRLGLKPSRKLLEKEERVRYRSVKAEALRNFQSDPVIERLLEHAQLRKLHSSFYVGLKKKIYEGRVHPTFNQAGAVSGRISANNPNVQQIPSRSERGKHIREVFVAGPGNVLVVADLSQIELRVLAHFTQDPKLIEVYRKGISLHKQNALLAFGPNYTPEQYSYAKNAGFSAVYGAVAATMARKYRIPLSIAEQILDSFYATYRRVNPWKEEVWEKARSQFVQGKTPPYVTTILGRKRRLPALLWLDRLPRRAAERQAVSVTISGSAADLFKLAMIRCHAQLQRRSWEGHIVMTVHDELVVEVPEEHGEEALQLVIEAMTGVVNPSTGKPILSVPIEVEAKLAKRWSEGKG